MDSGKEGDLESSAEGKKKKKHSSFECVCLEVLPMCKVVLNFIARMASLQRSRAGQILSPWGLAGFWQVGLCLVLLGWQLWSVPCTAGTCQCSVLRACCIPLLTAQLCGSFGLGLLAPSWGWGDPPVVPWAPQHPWEKLPGALAMHQQLNLPLLPVGQSSYRCCAAPGMGAPHCCAPCDGGAELGHRDWLSEAGERIN